MSLRTVLVLASVTLVSCGAADAQAPNAVAPTTGVPSATPAAAPATVLWTAPPTSPARLTPSPTPSDSSVAIPAAPATAAAPLASPRPTRTPDPFKWTGYSVSGSAVFVPAAWTVVEPSALRGLAIFAASPEAPRVSIVGYRTVVRLQFVASAAPSVTLDAFADALRDTIPGPQVTRERIGHPSGGAILFKYQVPGPDGVDQVVEAVIMGNGHVFLLSLRSPLDRVSQNAPIFNEIVQRFRPG